MEYQWSELRLFMGKSLRMVSFSILVAYILICPKKVSPCGHFTKTLSRSIDVFSSLGLCLIVLALKVPRWATRYLPKDSLTQQDTVEELLAFIDSEFVLIDLWLAVAFFDFDLALGHVVVDHVVLTLDLPLTLLVLMPPVDFRSPVHILSQVVLVLLLLLVLGVSGVCIGGGVLLGATAR